MLFNSFIFLYAFLPITYVVFWSLHSKQHRYQWLTAASYVFYGYWNYKFCFWMALSTSVSFVAGLGLLHWHDSRRRWLCVAIPITIDLLILGVFKYTNFFLGTVQWGFGLFHIDKTVPWFNIILPIGISFYTFHTISYMVDAYRGVIKPTQNFWEFACYVSLFSQLVAGPIVRFRQVEGDLEQIDHADRRARLDKGWSFFVIGLMKKVIIADSLALFIDPALKNWTQLSTVDAWLCVLGYTYQLYFDFSGYSDMAVGLGHMFGLRLPQNFNSPYKADSPSDFWRRWHMSLSTCMRDYLYIPLGGSRGPAWFVARNLLITMLIGGLWHGANWTFVVWGAYHGLLLMLLRWNQGRWDRLPMLFRQTSTFAGVMVGWVFFRSTTFGMAIGLFKRMLTWNPTPEISGSSIFFGLIVLAAFIAHGRPNTFEMSHEWSASQTSTLAVGFVFCLFMMYGSSQSPFLYFQF